MGENNLTNEDEIYSYGFWEKCFKIVTPIVKLPKEILNFSTTKFYQNILYNKNMITFSDVENKVLTFNFEKIDSEKNDAASICRNLK